MGRGFRAPFLLATAAVAIYLWPAATAWLEYHRVLIESGQLWRLLSCQWTHCSAGHLFFDVLVLLVAGTIYRLRGGKRLGACIVASAVLIPAGLWVLLPEMARYRGLSGVDVAVTAMLAIAMLRDGISSGDRLSTITPALLVAAIVIKIGYEVCSGQTVFVDAAADGFVTVPVAHLLGAMIGGATELLPTTGTLTGSSLSRVVVASTTGKSYSV
jgi:rhomboid family GlyGly-CTERM serine protease